MASKMAEKKKSTSRSQMADLKASASDKEQPVRNVKTKEQPVRNERKEQKEQPKQETKAIRRDAKGSSSLMKRLRNNNIGRFALDAYYELRHKVTWPTFQEARNMTIAVIIISLVIGAMLAAADFGLYRLFLLIVGRGS
ncbi:MAG: preprotein translocase subunit SecE [Ktedonobacteraceae bacterium]|nr:MAG: preprotein translocase subunit SecE [Chloroflexota bacterium]